MLVSDLSSTAFLLGRGREVQKDGAGAHNWGPSTEPVDGAQYEDVHEEEAPAAAAAPTEAPAAEGAAAAAPEGEPEEEEDKTISYEAYLKKTAAKVDADEALKPRQVEDEDIEGYEPMAADDEEDILGASVEKKEGKEKTAAKKVKKQLDIPIYVNRGEDERRGRGRGRGMFEEIVSFSFFAACSFSSYLAFVSRSWSRRPWPWRRRLCSSS